MRRKYLIKHVIEGKFEGRIEVTGGRERRRKQVPDDVRENRKHWNLKAKALASSRCMARFGRA